MKFLLSIAAVACTFIPRAQTRLIKDVAGHCQYYVLKSDERIKHGNYLRFNTTNNSIQIDGYYKNNKKDSLWIQYNEAGSEIVSKGFYKDDKRVGTWEFYNFMGQLTQKYDFDHDSLLENHAPTLTQDSVLIFRDRDSTYIMPVDGPSYIGGPVHFAYDMQRTIQYPEMARDYNIYGRVYLSFLIDKKGEVSDFRVLRSPDKMLTQEAIRCIKNLSGNFIPAVSGGQKVPCRVTLPVNFILK